MPVGTNLQSMVRGFKRALCLVCALGVGFAGAARGSGSVFIDNFNAVPPSPLWTGDTGTDGQWTVQFTGYGRIGEETDQDGLVPALAVSPAPADATTAPQPPYPSPWLSDHAALVTSGPSFGDSTLNVRERTVTQLRTGQAPNAWEVGWVLWHYTDNTHFYYLLLKPNGWELGKEDPAYPGNQRFLATGGGTFAVGTWHSVSVSQIGNQITASADGNQLVTFVDTERPYLSGSVGLYSEDAYVHFARVAVSLP